MIDKPRILLIQLYSELQFPNSEPLSIEILASALDLTIPNVSRELLTLNCCSSEMMGEIFRQQYDIVGISVPQGTYDLACQIIDEFGKFPEAPLMVLGHALPTYSPHLFLQRNENIIIVRGWGEDTFVSIVKQYMMSDHDWRKIPGIVLAQNGETIRTEVAWPQKYTVPVRLNPEAYFARVESSRGCSHNLCTFCTRPPRNPNEKHWIRFPTNEVIDCVKKLVADGISSFTFTDEDFIGDDLDEAFFLAESLRRIGGIKFSISIRVENVYDVEEGEIGNGKKLDLLNLLKAAGLSLVFLGVESLSNSQLKRYGKGTTVAENIRSIQILDQLEIKSELGFIIFDPLMSLDELVENLENLKESGFWVKTGNLLRQLRIQEQCMYKNMLAKKGLLRQYHPPTMDYQYRYDDLIVARIADRCLEWNKDIKYIYKLTREIFRSDFAHEMMKQFTIRLRELNFNFLLSLVTPYADTRARKLSGKLITTEEIEEERFHLLNTLKASIEPDLLGTEVAQALEVRLNEFLARRKV